jgi:hypothetical protein
MLRGSINSKKYTGIIKEGAYPTILEVSQTFPQTIFHDDNAPCQTASMANLNLFLLLNLRTHEHEHL